MQCAKNLIPLQCSSAVSHELVVNNGEIFDRPQSHGPAEERHHEIVEVCVHGSVQGDAESEIGGGNDTHWPTIHPIRTVVEVGKVGEPGMIWEN